MGIFILNETFHPRRNRDHNYLSGSVFGMIERFQGFGVILDTYDNDGNRDNPKAFAIKQKKREKLEWNHDNDFADNMVKDTVSKDAQYECTNNYRNAEKHGITLRYIN
eukprot:TRINITY_DN3942_c0_g1_i1.p1 TRINITY_DN3942_c0_g1~~TRINITY_DN3942_c0_g1_i1.p1  ORF type:complete len:108 (+),score=15.78 TRINITY_DN3942_c0_g1_i1:152-475(+)